MLQIYLKIINFLKVATRPYRELARNKFIRLSLLTKINKKTLKYCKKNIEEDLVKTLTKSVSYVFGMAVEGDIAEFGTMTGKTAVILATATNYNNSLYIDDIRGTKKIFYFDSFEGLPEARFDSDKNSHHVKTGIWRKGSCMGLTESRFKEVVSKFISPDSFKVYKGWFKDTLPTVSSTQKFSLIHIDGDLYESAIDVLNNLFSKGQVTEGAVVLFDDWNCNNANPNLGERKAFTEICNKYNVQFSDAGSYGVAAHRFIIHSYKK